MTETRLGPWVRRFLLEHLVGERNLARNTQQSYRDSLALLIPFIAGKVHKTVDQLEIDHLRHRATTTLHLGLNGVVPRRERLMAL